MQQIEFGKKLNCPIVLCLGYFGCMHNGHVKLVEVAQERARKTGAKLALFTFSNNHLKFLGKDTGVVYTFEERLHLYESLGVDVVLSAEFDEHFRSQTGEQFVLALKKYALNGVVCGFDYTFGKDRLGGKCLQTLLSDTCPVDIVDAICWDGVKISTTLVRKLLSQDKIEAVNNILSEPFFVEGKVVSGRHIGTEMGFPTANVQVDADKVLPIGVFGAVVSTDGKTYRAIVNIGQKPTFDLDCVNIEAHLIGFEGDLYDKHLKISLLKFLRPICKFDSKEDLAEQLKKDREEVQNDQIRTERKL